MKHASDKTYRLVWGDCFISISKLSCSLFRFLAKLQIVTTGQICKPVTLLANSVHYLP